ncbi:hypothetical protein C8Q79DRAFT_549235 [Trametes meyenii]|nr:hypothetical protein C8Q79DRAFT_549235 [Trametes meyenii]
MTLADDSPSCRKTSLSMCHRCLARGKKTEYVQQLIKHTLGTRAQWTRSRRKLEQDRIGERSLARWHRQGSGDGAQPRRVATSSHRQPLPGPPRPPAVPRTHAGGCFDRNTRSLDSVASPENASILRPESAGNSPSLTSSIAIRTLSVPKSWRLVAGVFRETACVEHQQRGLEGRGGRGFAQQCASIPRMDSCSHHRTVGTRLGVRHQRSSTFSLPRPKLPLPTESAPRTFYTESMVNRSASLKCQIAPGSAVAVDGDQQMTASTDRNAEGVHSKQSSREVRISTLHNTHNVSCPVLQTPNGRISGPCR